MQFSFDFLLIICVCSICTCVELSLNMLEVAFTEQCVRDDSGHPGFQALVNGQAEILYVWSDT